MARAMPIPSAASSRNSIHNSARSSGHTGPIAADGSKSMKEKHMPNQPPKSQPPVPAAKSKAKKPMAETCCRSIRSKVKTTTVTSVWLAAHYKMYMEMDWVTRHSFHKYLGRVLPVHVAKLNELFSPSELLSGSMTMRVSKRKCIVLKTPPRPGRGPRQTTLIEHFRPVP